jgi:hypothetical protein
MGWKEKANQELDQARQARLAGNEGKARVCARRAAGHILGEYFQRQALPDPGPSAYSRLQALLALPDLPPQVRELAGHFVLRTTPEFTLPVEADLIGEATRLSELLLKESLV